MGRSWDRERALDEREDDDLDVAAYDARCVECGAIYVAQPEYCHLCGSEGFEPVEGPAA